MTIVADKIFIKGLKLDASIGIYPHESQQKQPLIVDLELSVDTLTSAQSCLIKDTVDYDLVARSVATIVNKNHYNLLETLAHDIATYLLSNFNVTKVVCSLCKPKAIANAQAVGVSIERTA